MLADRDYMREPERHRPTVTTVLLWVLGACFVIQSILEVYAKIDVSALLGLSRAGFTSGRIWQLLTFQFLHSVPLPFHVLSNCLGLYFFGRTVETVVGARRYLLLYFGGGVLGGLLQLLVNWAMGYPPASGLIGASAGVCVMIGAFCNMFPEREACMIFYFFPVRLRAVVFFWIVGAYSLWGTCFPNGGIAHAAHLGGLMLGYAYVRLAQDGAPGRWLEKLTEMFRRRPPAKIITPRFTPGPVASATPSKPVGDDTDYITREVDPILDKIAAQGIQSLTAREKKTLEDARARMGKR